MDKIAVGPGYPEGVIDLDATPADNVRALAKAKGVEPADITACVLDRPRHDEHHRRAARRRLRRHADHRRRRGRRDRHHRSGDRRSTSISGQGGAPEGVLAARRCTASAARSRGGWCSATTTSAPARANGASTDLDREIHADGSGHGRRASSPPPASPTARCWTACTSRPSCITTESIVMRCEHRHDPSRFPREYRDLSHRGL